MSQMRLKIFWFFNLSFDLCDFIYFLFIIKELNREVVYIDKKSSFWENCQSI